MLELELATKSGGGEGVMRSGRTEEDGWTVELRRERSRRSLVLSRALRIRELVERVRAIGSIKSRKSSELFGIEVRQLLTEGVDNILYILEESLLAPLQSNVDAQIG